MALGRKTGGRQKGTPNRRTRELIEAVEKEGVTPLDYLLGVMRDGTASKPERLEAAKAAAPYVHARLSSVEADINSRGGYQAIPIPVELRFDMEDEELMALAAGQTAPGQRER